MNLAVQEDDVIVPEKDRAETPKPGALPKRQDRLIGFCKASGPCAVDSSMLQSRRRATFDRGLCEHMGRRVGFASLRGSRG